MYWLSRRDYEPILEDYAAIDIIEYSMESQIVRLDSKEEREGR